jgi:hypothetical protein
MEVWENCSITVFFICEELGAERPPEHILVLKSWILGKVD